MSDSPRQVLQKWFAAFADGDMDAAREIFPAEGILHIENPPELHGTYTGLDEFLNFYAKKQALAGDSFSYEVVDTLSGDHYAAAVLRLSSEIGGHRERWHQLALYRIEGDHIAEMWFFEPLA